MINTQDKINKILGKKGKRRLKSFKLVETIDDGNQDIAEVFKCQDCGSSVVHDFKFEVHRI